MSDQRRKCFKCGKCPITDNITLFRYPNPGVRNILKCSLWAKFMFPLEDQFLSIQFMKKLHSEHRMLCQDHFAIDDFTNASKTRLVSTAVPYDVDSSEDDRQHHQIIGTSSRQSISTAEHRVPTDGSYTVHEPAELEYHDQQRPEVPTDATIGKETSEQSTEVPFSWEQDSALVPTDDADLNSPTDEYFMADDDTSTYKEGIHTTEDHAVYRCNICNSVIKDFRYTCVQCSDYDLCGACEARQAHDTHYVLRIPGPRTHGEVSAMLHTIRRALLSDAFVHVADEPREGFEIKQEEEDLEDPINIENTEPTQDNIVETDPNESIFDPNYSLVSSIETEQNTELESQNEQIEDTNPNDNHRNSLSRVLEQKDYVPRTLQQKENVPKTLKQKYHPSRTLEQTDYVRISLQQSSTAKKIIQQKCAPPKIKKPIILQRRNIIKPVVNTSKEQDSSKNIESISKSTPSKRSIAQSIAEEYSKKMKIKEIELLPVPDDVLRQLEGKARVNTHKLTSTHTSLISHAKNSSDSGSK